MMSEIYVREKRIPVETAWSMEQKGKLIFPETPELWSFLSGD